MSYSHQQYSVVIIRQLIDTAEVPTKCMCHAPIPNIHKVLEIKKTKFTNQR